MGFLKFFPIFMPKNKLLFAQSLFFKEKQWENCSGHSLLQSDYEQFAPVALYKIAIVSYLLRSLMTKERREQFALSQEWITQKTDEQIPNPGLEQASTPHHALFLFPGRRHVSVCAFET